MRRDRPEMEGERRRTSTCHRPASRFSSTSPQGKRWKRSGIPSSRCVYRGREKALSLDKLSRYGSESRRFLVIGISGVWNWRGKIGQVESPNGKRLEEKGAISDFDWIEWGGRTVFVCFDSDWRTNDKVSAARRFLFRELKGRKARPRGFDIPEEAGVKGIDDWIVAAGPKAVFRCFSCPCSHSALHCLSRRRNRSCAVSFKKCVS